MKRTAPLTLAAMLCIAWPAAAFAQGAPEAGAADFDIFRIGGPNRIETLRFTLSEDASAVDARGVALTFWTRGCRECRQDGRITGRTTLWSIDGERVPLRWLEGATTYEAVSIAYVAPDSDLIERIVLTGSDR